MFKISYDKKITLVQGDTGVIRMRIHNYELSQGDEVRFAIVNKVNPSILLCQHSDKKIVLEKQVTVFEKDGSARILIQPYDTEYLQPGKYLYEIQVKTKDGRVDTVVPLTSFTLMDGSIQGEFGQTTPSKPEPTPSEIELRFVRLENEIIPELGTRITNVEKEIDNISSSLETNTNGINNIKTDLLHLKRLNEDTIKVMNNADTILKTNGALTDFSVTGKQFDSDIFPFKPCTLSAGVTNYYGENSYPVSAKLDENGIIRIKGYINATNVNVSDGTAELFTLPFDYSQLTHSGMVIGTVTGWSATNSYKKLTAMLFEGGIVKLDFPETNREFLGYISLDGLTFETSHYSRDNINTHLNLKCNEILSRNGSFVFPFLTDYHVDIFDNRAMYQMEAINYLDSLLNFNCYLSGGDNIVEPFTINPNAGYKQALLSQMKFASSIPKEKMLWVKGNHDDNGIQNSPNNANYVLRPPVLKPIIMNYNAKYGGNYDYYGYWDDEKAKVRVVMIDTFETDYSQINTNCPKNISIKQLKFIAGQALNFEDKENKSEWHTIFVGHIPPLSSNDNVLEYDGSIQNGGALLNIIKAFKNGNQCTIDGSDMYRFDLQGAMPVVAYFYGHYHRNQNQVVEGINFISSSCVYNVGYVDDKRKKGTLSEICVDVVSIDKAKKMVYLDRVGTGSSRQFRY